MTDQTIVMIGLACLAILALWLAVRSEDRARARRDAVDLRVRTLAQGHLKIGGAFGYGAAAALLGEEAWTNPHCTPAGAKDKGAAWAAGWCYGRQQLDDARRAED